MAPIKLIKRKWDILLSAEYAKAIIDKTVSEETASEVLADLFTRAYRDACRDLGVRPHFLL